LKFIFKFLTLNNSKTAFDLRYRNIQGVTKKINSKPIFAFLN